MHPIISALLVCVIALICSNSAKKRGRNPVSWFLIGLILGLIGLIILYLLPPKLKIAPATSPSAPARDTPEPITSPSIHAPSSEEAFVLWYYLEEDNTQRGPMSFNALQEIWETQAITDSTYVWNETMEGWKTLRDLPELLKGLNENF